MFFFFLASQKKNQTFFHSESVDWSTIFLWGMNDRKTIVTVATTIIFYDQCNFFSNTSHLFSVFVINLIKQQISKNSILTSTKHAIFPPWFLRRKEMKEKPNRRQTKKWKSPRNFFSEWNLLLNHRF